jgi:glucoamylase
MNTSLFDKFDKNYFIRCLIRNCKHTENEHTIIASPSKEDPDYYYEWVRDSGIVINHIIDMLNNEQVSYKDVEIILKNYVDNHLHFQNICIYEKHLVNEIDINLGEPKFNTDGTIYKKSWGRPQNDGPALRSIAMIKYTNYLLKNQSKVNNYISKNLYDTRHPISHTIIKRDLEYICKVWKDKCFDLWEEIYGHHFYTLMVQKEALRLGSKLAYELNDKGASKYYLEVSDQIDFFIIKNFYKDNRIISSINISNREYDIREDDIAVLLAFLHTKTEFNTELVNSVVRLVNNFMNEYEINTNGNYDVMIGRYPNDEYYGGNPWVLTTAALACFFRRLNFKELDLKILHSDLIKMFSDSYENINDMNMKFKTKSKNILLSLFEIEELNITNVNMINPRNMSFAEQIKKNDHDWYEYISANKLTWNYVEILRAMN